MPRVPAHLRERALGMLQGGMRTADVARAINRHVRTVRRLRRRYRETGRTADHPRSGRPRVTTPAQDRYIRISHLRDRYRMATTTARVTPGTHNPSISAQTVRNRQSMRRRCTAVLQAAGGHTRYWLVLLILSLPSFRDTLWNIFSLCLMVLTLLVFIQIFTH